MRSGACTYRKPLLFVLWLTFSLSGIATGSAAAQQAQREPRGGEQGSAAPQNESQQGQQSPSRAQGRSPREQRSSPREQSRAQGQQQTNASGSGGGNEKAQVGAGTTAGTTNGASQAQVENGQEGHPPLPQPKLCSSYQGEVREQCLHTVLRNDSRQAAGAGASASKQAAGQGARSRQ
jgi:hypothetical protein